MNRVKALWVISTTAGDVMFAAGLVGVMAALFWGMSGNQAAGLTGLACIGVMLVSFVVACFADEMHDSAVYAMKRNGGVN